MNKLSLKQALFIIAALPVSAMTQGTNDGLGGGDVDIKSLYELVTKHEQKSKALNIYINYGTCYQTPATPARASGPHASTTATSVWRW